MYLLIKKYSFPRTDPIHDLFNFDPGVPGRSMLGENMTIRAAQLQKKYGAGTDFLIRFSGNRIANPVKANCCCKLNATTKLYECN
jgi:hypothetical protein